MDTVVQSDPSSRAYNISVTSGGGEVFIGCTRGVKFYSCSWPNFHDTPHAHPNSIIARNDHLVMNSQNISKICKWANNSLFLLL